jgi:hypothetical protein
MPRSNGFSGTLDESATDRRACLEPDLAQRSSHSPQSRSESNFWFRCYRIPKNNGRELRAKGNAEPVRVHDFKIPELGKVAPYGRPEDSGDPPAAWHQQMDRASPVRLHHSNCVGNRWSVIRSSSGSSARRAPKQILRCAATSKAISTPKAPRSLNARCRRSTLRVTISTPSGTILSRLTNNLPEAVISWRAP